MEDVKTERYDRQLRLWGRAGQACLERAAVCVLGSTPTATETLKNLVLPGIGSFTIIDDASVTHADLANNFFVSPDHIGRPRADVTCELLGELNPFVTARSVVKDPHTCWEEDPEFFREYALVLATQVPWDKAVRLSEVLHKQGIPLMCLSVYGMVGKLRVDAGVHEVHFSKCEHIRDDLRLDCPFPALLDHLAASRCSFEGDREAFMHVHAHIPYVLLLLEVAEQWKAEHGGALPATPAERDALRAALRGMMWASDEQNFAEALKSVYRVWTPTTIPSNTAAVFSHPKCINLTKDSTPFWFVAAALKRFTEGAGGGRLPVCGVLSDMTADTASFVALQRVYEQQAGTDAAEVARLTALLLGEHGLDPATIPHSFVEQLCRDSRFIHCIDYNPLPKEGAHISPAFLEELPMSPDVLGWYLPIRAAERFRAVHGRLPGDTKDDDVCTDVASLQALVNSMAQQWSLPEEAVLCGAVEELIRCGSCELHNTAAFMGGVTSQEAIKLLTHLYLPVDNTFLFNGVLAAGASFRA